MDTILIVDDDRDLCFNISSILKDEGYNAFAAGNGQEAIKAVERNSPDVVLLDVRLPGTGGIEVLKKMKKIDKSLVVIMLTAYGDIKDVVKSMKLGAFDYVTKPITSERLKIIVERALESRRLSRQVEYLTKGTITLNEIIGQSQPMLGLFKMIKSVAQQDVSVILRGETGTGKEMVARAIHTLSRRKDNSFVPVDCATLPETLVESELFGYEKGAFTDANALKVGKFETAEKGTLFLDEIGNLTTHIQIKLLRVLQERKIERLGGKDSIPINVRIISATNKDLEEAVARGEFRDDLYHRLNVFEIVLPPLRERGDDAVFLAKHLLAKFNKEMGKNVKGFSDETMDIFKKCSWPGNVRELENAMKFAVISAKDKILPEHLPDHIRRNEGMGPAKQKPVVSKLEKDFDGLSLKEAKRSVTEDIERYLIEKTLIETNWNKKKTSEILNIDYKGLFTKIKKYEITQ